MSKRFVPVGELKPKTKVELFGRKYLVLCHLKEHHDETALVQINCSVPYISIIPSKHIVRVIRNYNK